MFDLVSFLTINKVFWPIVNWIYYLLSLSFEQSRLCRAIRNMSTARHCFVVTVLYFMNEILLMVKFMFVCINAVKTTTKKTGVKMFEENSNLDFSLCLRYPWTFNLLTIPLSFRFPQEIIILSKLPSVLKTVY